MDGLTAIEMEVGGERLVLRGDRSLYWPREQVLVIADLHLGKTESLRSDGVALPDGAMAHDLARLALALEETGAQRLLILGDLVHDAAALSLGVRRAVAEWRSRISASVHLVLGNHDQRVDTMPNEWRLQVAGSSLAIPPFHFVHEHVHPPPQPQPQCHPQLHPLPHPHLDPHVDPHPHVNEAGGEFTWSGHLHPVLSLRSATDAVRVPCFLLRPHAGVLPAFSTLTGGAAVRLAATDRAVAVVDGMVIHLPTP
ncbi:MAG: metallophosphoesterase [Gemmatimonadaceae bacterium]|nr:metallophosphoesterase [Gemmatimonadaceae bacterium]